MALVFNADEVFEMAEQIERNGAAFYREAARLFPTYRDMLLTVAEQEDRHEVIFSALRQQAAKASGQAPGAALDEDGAAYLRALADRRVVDTRVVPADLLAGAQTPADAIATALQMEKDAIVFYLGLKNLVPHALGRDQLDLILQEEQRHIVFLHQLLDKRRPADRPAH